MKLQNKIQSDVKWSSYFLEIIKQQVKISIKKIKRKSITFIPLLINRVLIV